MTYTHPAAKMQRSHGAAAVTLALRNGRAGLVDLAQSGSAKVILPQDGAGMAAVPELVFLNTSGGLTGGDRLSYTMELGDGVRAMATTQTAERAYRSDSGAAAVTVHAQVGANGWLDWLPQETILFQACALHRSTRIDLAADAGCLVLETVILGRAAMGEVVTRVSLRDRREIWRQGRAVIIEPFALNDETLHHRAALLAGASVMTSVAFVTQAAQDALAAVRAVLNEPGVQAAASGWDGRLTIRLMAQAGWPVRRQILRLLAVLRPGQAAPRVWQI